MPSIRTRFFDQVDCALEDVITFPAGIPPFAASTRFVLLANDSRRPLVFLQSVDDETLCFITVPIGVVDRGYQLSVDESDLRLLGWAEDRQPSPGDLSCLAILTVPEQGPVTANLFAPVLIDTASRLGVQAVRGDNLYTHAHTLEPPSQAGA